MKPGSDSLGWSLPGLSGCSLTGQLLVETGMKAHPAVDAHCRPRRRHLAAALAGAGARTEEVQLVSQLPAALRPRRQQSRLPGRPILTQRVELESSPQG